MMVLIHTRNIKEQYKCGRNDDDDDNNNNNNKTKNNSNNIGIFGYKQVQRSTEQTSRNNRPN